MKKIINIEGMHCEHCSSRVTKALSSIDGVKKVKVDLKKKTAEIDSSIEIDNNTIIEAIDEVGFEVVSIK